MPKGVHDHHASGSNHPRWNGGTWKHIDGYVAVKVPKGHHLRMANGYAYQHQLVAEEMLGRPLTDNEAVHHKNGIKDDNRPENLEVMTRTEHAVGHSKQRKRDVYGRMTTRNLPPPIRDEVTGRMKPR